MTEHDPRQHDRRESDRGQRRRAGDAPRYLDPGETILSLWGRVIVARYKRWAAAATETGNTVPVHVRGRRKWRAASRGGRRNRCRAGGRSNL